MDFSETYRHSGPAPVFSPNGRYVAAAMEYRLVVRDIDSLQVVQLYSCLDKIQHIEWCCNSNYILCGLYKRAIVQIWSVEEPEWTCKIDEGPAGVQHAVWSPDGLHVLVVADFQIRITIWSLVDRTCSYIKGPKFADKGIAFSPDGRLLALAERYDCKDFVSIFTCKGWQPVTHVALTTTDLADLAWSPDGSCFVVWDSPLAYKIVVHAPDGSCLAEYSAYSDALGIKSLQWSPSGQMLCIGSFDQEARLVNHATWNPLAELSHPSSVTGPQNVVVYKEIEEDAPRGMAAGASPISRIPKSRYVVCELPVKVPSQKPAIDKPNPKLGVGKLAWSVDGRYLVTRNDNMPSAAWVWDVASMELASVMLQCGAVKDMAWDPHHARLIVATGGTKIYIWSPEGASCVHIPLQSFEASAVRWSPDGTALILGDRDTFCCAYIGSI